MNYESYNKVLHFFLKNIAERRGKHLSANTQALGPDRQIHGIMTTVTAWIYAYPPNGFVHLPNH